MSLAAPLTTLKGVGPRMAERLERLGLRGVEDLLFHLPYRYQDRTQVAVIGALRPGAEVVVEGEVQACDIRFGKRRSLLCRINDGTGSMTLCFFHFTARQQAGLVRGARLRCFGEVRRGAMQLEMIHPEYEVLNVDQIALPETEQHLTPLYHATDGLAQKSLRQLTDRALERLAQAQVVDYLPPELVARLGMPNLAEALQYVHRPPPDAPVESLLAGAHPAQQRLAFEELLAHHLSLRQLRYKMQRHSAPPIKVRGELLQRLLAALPFTLTGAQQRVIAEVFADLAQPHPMQRLVQGDVGSGKTLVAAAAALQAVEAGYQVAVMAPTELLAEQHLRNFRSWCEPLGLQVAWFSGKQGVKARRDNLALLADGTAALAVGTHALFQNEVVFNSLGLVIVDEQHRFGVHQRLALREKGRGEHGRVPHQLIMTATPIPRTLAMTAYADLDSSIIDELPPGRTPVETVVISDDRREEVVARVHHACASEGRQAYWVCTLIEESDLLQCQAAEETAVVLTEALPDLRIGLIHGRMKSAQKEAVMASFKSGELQLLVATTVIEVGVDVPNASLMIIDNAERLGLAQLHQLRGRVGRGSVSSRCVLMYHKPLSEAGRARLAALRETNDGFEIARRDLELRGPGEVLGTRQSGLLQLRTADLQRDKDLLPQVAAVAQQLLQQWPERVPLLIARWLGEAQRYGDV